MSRSVVMYGLSPEWAPEWAPEPYEPAPFVPVAPFTPEIAPIFVLPPQDATEALGQESVATLVGKLKCRLLTLEKKLAEMQNPQDEADQIRKMLEAIGQK